jgi:ketosteroid isomerase-like protein
MMTTRLLIAALLIVGTGIANAAESPAASKDGKAESALKALDRDWSMSAATLDSFITFYADDAQMFPPNSSLASGKDAIKKVWAGVIALPGFAISWEPSTAVVSKSGDVAYTTGTYTFTANGADGKPAPDKGKYVAVWKKVGGKWKVVADIWNSDTAAK